MCKFWMVYRDGNYPPVKKHASFNKAQEEAFRLCKKHPEENFYVLEVVSAAIGSVKIVVVEIK